MKTTAKILGFVMALSNALPSALLMAQAAQNPQAAKLSQDYVPILSHELTLSIPYLVSLSALDKEARKLASQDEADRLFTATLEAIKSPGETDKVPNATPVYKDELALLQYYISHIQVKDNQARVKSLGELLERSAATFSETSKNPAQQVVAQFYSKLGKFIKSDGTDGISELIPLKDKLNGNKDLLASVELLVGYSLAMSPSTSEQGLQTMAKIANDVSVYGRVAIKLTESLSEYGLDADGSPVSAARPGAEAKLTYCVQLARGMPAGIQFLVLNSSVYIWSKANTNPTARAPTFLKDGFPGVASIEALRERDALLEVSAQNYKQASTLYRKIAEAYTKGEQMAAIDGRIWEIEQLSFQKSGQFADLETAFISLRQKYANIGKKGFHTTLGESYRKILDGSLDTGASGKAQKPQQMLTIQFTTRYLKTEPDRVVAYPLKSKLAALYRSMRMFSEAVEVYLEIAKDQPLKNYLLAIDSQSQVANWPVQPDFTAKSREKNPERNKLLSIYVTVNQIKKEADWSVIAQIGLLNRALDQYKNAESIWMKALKADPSSKIAQDVGGLLLTEYNDAKRNDDLIELTHLFASKKVSPSTKGIPINYKPWLANASAWRAFCSTIRMATPSLFTRTMVSKISIT